jgi:hypothetical protein
VRLRASSCALAGSKLLTLRPFAGFGDGTKDAL